MFVSRVPVCEHGRAKTECPRCLRGRIADLEAALRELLAGTLTEWNERERRYVCEYCGEYQHHSTGCPVRKAKSLLSNPQESSGAATAGETTGEG